MIPRHRPPFGTGRVLSELLLPDRKSDISTLERMYAHNCGVSDAVWLPSARAGILWMLQAFCSSGTTVLCPAYTCSVVHEAVGRSEASLKLLDSDSDRFLIGENQLQNLGLAGNSFALILCEVYGHIYDLPAVQHALGTQPSIRILDMAMTIPEPELCQRLGKNDVALLSFGIGKSMYAGWGGMGLTCDSSIANELRRLRDAALSPVGFRLLFDRAATTVARTLAHEAVLYGALRLLTNRRNVKRGVQEQRDIDSGFNSELTAEWHAPSTFLDRSLASHNLSHIDEYRAKRLSLAKRYERNLKGVSHILVPMPSKYPLSHYTIRVPAECRQVFRKSLWSHGVDVGTLFGLSSYVGSSECSNAYQISTEVLNLPININMSLDDVDYICSVIYKISSMAEPQQNGDQCQN